MELNLKKSNRLSIAIDPNERKRSALVTLPLYKADKKRRSSILGKLPSFNHRKNEKGGFNINLDLKTGRNSQLLTFDKVKKPLRSLTPLRKKNSLIKYVRSKPMASSIKKKLDYKVFPNEEIQQKIDRLITPYNSTLSLEKHMDFSSDGEAEENQRTQDMNDKKWQFLSNILTKEKKGFIDFIAESVAKVNKKPAEQSMKICEFLEKEEVTFTDLTKIAEQRRTFNVILPKASLESECGESPIEGRQRHNMITQLTRNFIIEELPEIFRKNKKKMDPKLRMVYKRMKERSMSTDPTRKSFACFDN